MSLGLPLLSFGSPVPFGLLGSVSSQHVELVLEQMSHQNLSEFLERMIPRRSVVSRNGNLNFPGQLPGSCFFGNPSPQLQFLLLTLRYPGPPRELSLKYGVPSMSFLPHP